MGIRLMNICFGNLICANRIIAIVSPESAPIKSLIQESREKGLLIDATYGRKTRAVIITDSDNIVLTAVQPETTGNRINSKEENIKSGWWWSCLRDFYWLYLGLLDLVRVLFVPSY